MRLTFWNERKGHFDWRCENSEIADKLADYEDAENQRRLVRLPCDVGDMVYYRRGRYVVGDTVRRIVIDEFGNRVVLDVHNKEFDFEEFGKSVSYPSRSRSCRKIQAAERCRNAHGGFGSDGKTRS